MNPQDASEPRPVDDPTLRPHASTSELAEAPRPAGWVPIRRLDASHRAELTAHLLALSAEDRYLRFGHSVSDEMVQRYVGCIDFERGEVLGIFNRKLELLGFAHLALMGPTEAEFGVSVLEKARGRGFGQRLFDQAVLHARNRGVHTLVVHTLSENQAMLRIARAAGAPLVRDAGEVQARLALPPEDLSSHIHQFIDDQVAEVDFHLKSQHQRMERFVETVGDIREQLSRSNPSEGGS